MIENRPRPQISVIIVTYNSAMHIKSALNNLSHTAEIIVFDNASVDATRDIVRTYDHPQITLVESQENIGFARAVNKAVAISSGEVILLLNPDAVIGDMSLKGVCAEFSQDAQLGIASPLVTEAGGGLLTAAGGYPPSIWRMFTHASGLSRLANRFPFLRGHYLLSAHVLERSANPVSWVSGGCMFVRRQTWNDLGGLTERWFMYAEDVEFCLRAEEIGWHVTIFSRWTADHLVGASSSPRVIRTEWIENLHDLYRTRYRAGSVRNFAWTGVVATGFIGRAIISLVFRRGRKSGTADAARFTAYAKALSTRSRINRVRLK